jgi:RNA polymerase sigma-70 factor, ECF subfamily
VSADDELIQRAKRGDATAWRELYRAHAGRLVVWLRTRPSGDAAVAPEDIAAEAWLTAAENIAEFRGTGEQFAGWLFGIARHLQANARRKSGRRDTHPTAQPEAEPTRVPDGPEQELMARDWVNRALAGLPPRERDVVACIDVVGLDVESTARALDISAVAVRVARHRGLARLRKIASQPKAASNRSR